MNLIRFSLKWIGLLSLGFLFQVTSAASSEVKTLQVVFTTWPPYTYYENEEAMGFEIDTFKAVIDKMGVKAKFTVLPWNRCLLQLENGDADVVISMLKTPEREKYTYYPETHISISKTMLFTTSDKDIPFDGSFYSLQNYSIGTMSGFSYGKDFDNATYLNKEVAFHSKMLIRKLLAGRNDVAIGNQAVINSNAYSLKVQNKIKFISPAIHTRKLYVGFSRKNSLELFGAEFSNTLNKFKTTNAYENILEKYGITLTEMIEDIN